MALLDEIRDYRYKPAEHAPLRTPSID